MRNNFKTCLCANCLKDLIADQQKSSLLLFFFFILNTSIFGQFHGIPGSANTSAMHKDSSAFIAWAKTCSIIRGWQDASDHSIGTTTVGVDENGTAKANDNPVVSLGDGGVAILTFSNAIKNGPGNDFAVFENGFADDFLELAFVEVSSDGVNYTRFPATSNTQNSTQIGAFDPLDCTKLNNLAGKYRANYGTPFDLEEIKNTPGLNVNSITHVKIIDVVGSITPSLATFDKNNNIINDPFPTAFGSGGFDLDAVGVINENPAKVNELFINNNFTIYPNPVKDKLTLSSDQGFSFVYRLIDMQGMEILSGASAEIDVSKINKGMYLIELNTPLGHSIKKVLVE